MAPRSGKPAAVDPDGIFSGMVVFLLPKGVQSRRLLIKPVYERPLPRKWSWCHMCGSLVHCPYYQKILQISPPVVESTNQSWDTTLPKESSCHSLYPLIAFCIWKQKLLQMGATIENNMSKKVTHIFALNSTSLDQLNRESLKEFKGRFLSYEWLESCLKSGSKVSEDPYILEMVTQKDATPKDQRNKRSHLPLEITYSDNKQLHHKKAKIAGVNSEAGSHNAEYCSDQEVNSDSKSSQATDMESRSSMLDGSDVSSSDASYKSNEACSNVANTSEQSTLYSPPDLNKNITEIFGKLINIYRALGDDRRSFSYYKAIPVIEKLPFKIENVDQVKDLPTIGKSLKDHIQEIITTGKLSKVEHFEKDEKVRTVSLFGEVWGIGPATALKLYEKGYRTLDDLKNEESLTHSQRIGLQFFDDIKKRIPRDEVRDMEMLLQKAGELLLPGGTDSGVDTYFGLCTYPGREQRHRIDFKVYPRSIYAFGLIAWTGNDVLNRRLRLLAESKGYKLDDTGLFLATKGSSRKQGVKSTTSVKCDTEREPVAVGQSWCISMFIVYNEGCANWRFTKKKTFLLPFLGVFNAREEISAATMLCIPASSSGLFSSRPFAKIVYQ